MKFLYMFGLNEDGQCDGGREKKDKVYFPKLLKLSPYVEFVSVSCGSRHTLALTSTGAVFSWGWGQVGQLGHGEFQSISSPRRVEHLHHLTLTHISAGGMHSACIDAQHQCYTWGSNTYGQLGIGDLASVAAVRSSAAHSQQQHVPMQPHYSSRNVPHIVLLLPTDSDGVNASPSSSIVDSPTPLLLKSISCGGMHTVAIDMNDKLLGWGKADNGQIGFSNWYVNFSPSVWSPKRVPGLSGERCRSVSCGGFYTIVMTESGKAFAMGKEDFGCLGISSNLNTANIDSEKPTLVRALADERVLAVKAAGWHSLFLTQQGDSERQCRLYVTGKGEYGRLGLGDEASRMTPVPMASDVLFASGGGAHTIWASTQQHIYTVGRLDGGRCGTGVPQGDRLRTPVDITAHFVSGFEVAQIEAGGSFSAVLLDYPHITSVDQVPGFYAEFDNFKV